MPRALEPVLLLIEVVSPGRQVAVQTSRFAFWCPVLLSVAGSRHQGTIAGRSGESQRAGTESAFRSLIGFLADRTGPSAGSARSSRMFAARGWSLTLVTLRFWSLSPYLRLRGPQISD